MMSCLRFIFRCLIPFLWVFAVICRGDDATLIEGYMKEVERERLHPRIGTPMKLEIFRVQYLGGHGSVISAEVVERYMEDAAVRWQLNTDPEEIIKLTDGLKLPNTTWSEGVFLRSQEKLRIHLTSRGSGVRTDHFQSQDESIRYASGSEQLAIYRGDAGWGIDDTTDIFPSHGLTWDSKSSQDLGGGVIRFDDSRGAVDWDSTSRVIVRTFTGNASQHNRRRFAGYTEYNSASGHPVACPGFSAQLDSSDGRCESLTVYLILSADFPPELPDSEFAISVPPATSVVLFSPGSMSESNASIRLADTESIEDARTLLPRLLEKEAIELQNIEDEKNRASQPAPAGARPWLFWGNLVGLILLGAGAVLFSSRKAKSTPMNLDDLGSGYGGGA